ncbi:MAG: FkbM family methyltransferase [Flavobacteriales bacterium]|nr:FkbM family methyltransferase [Flavobacteriales bacterium]MCZ2443017.1 FkbM family methyltransferase [Flavobacteriales bacterium]
MSSIKKIYRILPIQIRNKVRNLYYLKKFKSISWQDEKDLDLLKLFIKPDAIIMDIGANYGLYTRFMAELTGPKGQVYSFEPIPTMYHVLKNNVSKLKLTQVQIITMAVSNKTGKATMQVPTYKDGSENFYEASLKHTDGNSGISVETIRLDDKFEHIPSLDFIKIDIEGHEPEALEGAKNTITKHRPVMLIEINDGFAIDSIGRKVKEQMQEWGYTMYYYDGKNILPSSCKEEGVNYIFLTPEHLKNLQKSN